jgi:hypothetical protein
MITKDGERNLKAQKQYDSIKPSAKKNTGTGNKGGAPKSIPSASASTPKTTPSSSTSGSLTTPKPTESSTSNSSSSSSSSSSKKKSLSAAEKSKALSDLMDRATIGSSRTYGLSFQSSANRKISDTEAKRKQTLVEQATKNGYLVGQNTKQAQDFRNTVNQKLERAISSGKSPSEARADEQQRIRTQRTVNRDQEKGYNRTVSELNKQIAAIDSELAPLKNKIEGRYPVVGEKSGKTKEALTEERSKLIQKKKDVTGDYGVLDSIYNALEAGAGQFNSGVTSTLNAGKNVLMQLEAFANGGWDKESGKFVKGDAPFFGSLLQPVSDLNQSTKDTTAQFAQKAATGWNQYGKGGNLANQLIQGTISAVPNAVLAMATAGGSAAATLAPEASGLTATVADAVQKLSKDPMYWTSFVQSFGNSYDEAIEKGATEDEALLATLLSSTANAIVEVGGGVEQLPGELRKEGLTSAEKIRKWVSSSLDEGKEEVVQGMIERLVNKAVYNQDAPWNDDTGKNEDAVFNFDQSLKEFGMGAAIGGILGGGQMLAQEAINARNRIVDPTASPLDQAILDALQGVQTPENVTQTREATALDNAILAAMNQNKNSATFEQTTESPMNGPVRSNAAEAGTSNINAASEKIKGDFDKLIEKNKGKLSFNQWVDYGNSLQGEDAAALNAFLNDIETGKTQYKYDAGGGIYKVDPANHIDNHDISERMQRGGHSFQYDNPELHEYMKEAAELLLEDIADSTKGERFATPTENGDNGGYYHWTGTKRRTTKGIAELKDRFGITWDNLAKAAENIIKDEGAENYADARRVEFLLDDMLTNGYDAMTPKSEAGTFVPPNEAYIRAKQQIPGADMRQKSETSALTWLMETEDEQNAPKPVDTSLAANAETGTEERTWHAERQGASPAGTEAAQIEAPGAAPAGFDPLSHASNQYGAIPPGENPSRVVDIPASMDGETKVSRFSRTAAEAQITTDEMVGRIEQLVQDGKLSHEVYGNKQAIEDGAKQIEKQYARGKSIEQIRGEFIRDANAGKAGAKFVSQGTTLYADAIAEGDYNAASDILVALTAVETNAGQTVQAARLMKSLTPEGRIFTVQKMVSNLEAQINQRRAANKQIEINVPDALLQTYQNAATADAQEAALQNIYQNVADQIPTSLGEAAQQWRYFSMLANPSTHAKNIMGNVSGAVAKIGKDNLAALMETVFIGNKEGRTKAFLNPLNKADQNLLNLGWADYDNAVDLYEDSTGKYSNTAGDINDKRRYWKINDPQNALTRGIDKALNIAEKANNLNSKALEVEDMWFSKPMYSVALAGYMKANGLTEITDAARTYAMTEAKKGTYNDLNAVSKWATSLGKGSKLGRFLSSTVYPFKKVPANVMVRTVEYSPLGYLKGAWDLIQMQKGNPDITAAKAIDDFAAATTGTALLGVGAMLAKQGILRATGVGDDKEKEQQKNAFGAKDFSILVGDTYIPIDSLTLAGTGLLTGAQIWEAAQNARNGDEPISFEDFLDALSKITDPVFEQSMLSGMDSILTTIQNSDNAGTGELLTKMGVQIIGNYVGQYVPTIVGRVAASLDKNQRSTYLEPDGAWSPVQSAVQGVQKKLPGLREDMAVTYGNWGVPVEGNGANGFGEGVFKAVTPVYPSKQKTDAVEEEIARLHDVNAEYSNFYTKPPKSIAVDGENVKLTSEQYANYTETRGQTDYNLRKNMLDSDIYKGLPDNVKSKAMSLSQEYANALGKEAAGVGYESDEKWINGLKGKSDEEIVNAILGRAVESEKYISDEAKNKLGNVQKIYDSLAYAGVSDDLKESAREKAAEYFQNAEKAKFGYKLSEEQQKLEGKNQKTLAEYFLDEAVKAKYKDANKDGTNRDELLQAYNDNELNDRTAIAVLSAREVDAYQKFGKAAGVTPQMMLEASSAHARMHEVKDIDGIVTSSVQNQYDDWLDSKNLTEEQKKALRMGFYGDTVDTYNKLVEDLDIGNITVGEAKQALSPTYQYGWTHNVSSTGVQMRDYISSMATFENAPTAEERDKMGFDSKWEWFCNELNKNTELTKEQKYAIAISTDRSMSEKTKKKIANKLGAAYVAPATDGGNPGGTAVTSTGSATSSSGSYASSGTGGGTFSGWSSDAEKKSQAQKAYERFGMAAGATEAMYQEAKAALKNIETVYDMDGNVVRSAEDQFDSWLERRDWTEDQKDAVRAGFYADSVKNLRYLSSELREGNISVAAAKSELSARAQTGWTHSVMDTGAAMADYIDAWAQFKEAPNADERKSQGFGTKWAWFCDYLNQTDMTAEQKYAIAVSVQDYAESTRKKIQKNVGWDGVSSAEQEPQEETYDIRTDDGYREYLSLLLKRKDRYEAKDGSVWSVGENGDVIVRTKDGRQLRARAVLGRNGFDDEPGEGYTVGSKAGQLAYKMMQNGVMKTWGAPDGWTWKLVRGEIIAEKNGTKIPVRMAG